MDEKLYSSYIYNWKQYEYGLQYQRQMGFSNDLPIYERYKSGDQWSDLNEDEKSIPKPVFNIVDFFIRNKKANVLNQPIKMVFSPADEGSENDEGARLFTEYASTLWSTIDQDSLNDEIVEDAATFGTGIVHYYWNTANSEIDGEIIDPLNIFFGNPQQRDIQKQPWIIISKREEVSCVRETARINGIPYDLYSQINGDNDTSAEGYDGTNLEMETNRKVTVITKYLKKEGHIWYEKSIKNLVICPLRPLTPRHNLGAKITLFPIALFNWKRRKKCIFGYGEVESLIPNQKAINFNISMMLLSVQDTAWPKVLVKPGAVRQRLTNIPGEQVVDYSSGNGDGIKFMQPPSFPAIALNLAEIVLSLSRTTSGVSEVTTGEQIGSNMSASAIIALQNQAKTPIENIQRRFYKVIKDIGRIWEQFFKTYYTLPKNIKLSDGNTAVFKGDGYKNVNMDLKIDVGTGSVYSEALAVNTLDKFYSRNEITLKQYIELAPQSIVPFKEQLKEMIEKSEESENESKSSNSNKSPESNKSKSMEMI